MGGNAGANGLARHAGTVAGGALRRGPGDGGRRGRVPLDAPAGPGAELVTGKPRAAPALAWSSMERRAELRRRGARCRLRFGLRAEGAGVAAGTAPAPRRRNSAERRCEDRCQRCAAGPPTCSFPEPAAPPLATLDGHHAGCSGVKVGEAAERSEGNLDARASRRW